MMNSKSFQQKYGPWAVVVGAAEGIGEGFSVVLARSGMNLLMIDMEDESQNLLAEKLQKDFGIQCKTLTINLNEPDAPDAIMEMVKSVDCRLLIYNAAFSRVRRFTDLSENDLENFITINTRSELLLVHRFSRHLITRNQGGGILLMPSLAGLIGVQLVSVYAATKAFTWNLAEALHHELKDQNIDVMSCLAGATETPTYLATRPSYGILKPSVMKSERVAELSLRKLGKSHRYIPGFSNRFNYFLLTRIFPRKWAARIANNTIYSMYKDTLD